MPIYALGEHEPEIHPEAWIMPEAVLIGRVKIGARATVWSGACLLYTSPSPRDRG